MNIWNYIFGVTNATESQAPTGTSLLRKNESHLEPFLDYEGGQIEEKKEEEPERKGPNGEKVIMGNNGNYIY